MKKEHLVDNQLLSRFKSLDQSPRNGNSKIDPTVFALFIKDGVYYYAIAHDEKQNEILCFVSNAEDIDKPEWISINTLEEKSLLGLGKGVIRDYSFSETNKSNLRIEPYRNSIEEYYLEQKKDKDEQLKNDNMKVSDNTENKNDREVIEDFDIVRDNNESQQWER